MCLHEHDLLLQDLKVDNVLLDATGFIRLCDFGLSMDEFRDDDQVCSPCGTLFYVAPEVNTSFYPLSVSLSLLFSLSLLLSLSICLCLSVSVCLSVCLSLSLW